MSAKSMGTFILAAKNFSSRRLPLVFFLGVLQLCSTPPSSTSTHTDPRWQSQAKQNSSFHDTDTEFTSCTIQCDVERPIDVAIEFHLRIPRNGTINQTNVRKACNTIDNLKTLFKAGLDHAEHYQLNVSQVDNTARPFRC